MPTSSNGLGCCPMMGFVSATLPLEDPTAGRFVDGASLILHRIMNERRILLTVPKIHANSPWGLARWLSAFSSSGGEIGGL